MPGAFSRAASRRGALVVAAVVALALGGVAVVSVSRRPSTVLLAYVASAGNNHVQVIDLETGRTLRKIYAGTTPWRIVLAPDRKSLWVQHWYAATTAVIRLDDHEVIGAFPSRGPGAFDASGDRFSSFDWPATTLRRFGARSLELVGEESTEIPKVYDLVPDSKGKRLFLAQHDPMIQGPHQRYSYVLAYSERGQNEQRVPPASYPTGQSPTRMRLLAGGDFLLTLDSDTNGLTLINALGDRRSVETCPGPRDVLISPDETGLVVSCSPPGGGGKARIVSYRSDFRARPWPTLHERAARDAQGVFTSGTFSPSGERVYLVDRAHARMLELDAATLRKERTFATGDVPLDVVVVEVSRSARERLIRDEGKARTRLKKILNEMNPEQRVLSHLGWTETLEPPGTDAPSAAAAQATRRKLAFRAPDSLRSEADDGSVRLAAGGHSVSIDPDGRFWTGPRQDLTAALLSIWSLPVDAAIRQLAGDVPGSPYLRGGIAVDLIAEVHEGNDQYHLIGALQPKQRVSQLWVDARERRATNLVEQFPSFSTSGHGAASGGVVETKFYDYVRTKAGVYLPTRLERVIGALTQRIRIEHLEEIQGLTPLPFDLARLGGVAPRALPDGAPLSAAEGSDPTGPGRAVPILAAGYLKHPGEAHLAYNSNPPTSGPRLHSLADFGAHRVPVPPEIQVHNLEHGGVLIQYNCSAPCSDLVAKLEAVALDRPFVLVAPYPWMPARIALTAWGRMQTMRELDLAAVRRFIDAYAGKDHHAADEQSLSTLAR